MRIETADRWYEVRTLDDGVVHIQEPHILPFYRCNIWFVRGRHRSLLVDIGSGLVSLREQVACLDERPVLAVATHSHFDHIGSHHEFLERAVHPNEAHYLAEPDALVYPLETENDLRVASRQGLGQQADGENEVAADPDRGCPYMDE